MSFDFGSLDKSRSHSHSGSSGNSGPRQEFSFGGGADSSPVQPQAPVPGSAPVEQNLNSMNFGGGSGSAGRTPQGRNTQGRNTTGPASAGRGAGVKSGKGGASGRRMVNTAAKQQEQILIYSGVGAIIILVIMIIGYIATAGSGTPSASAQGDANRKVAVDFQKKGFDLESAGKYTEAIAAYQQAYKYDQTDSFPSERIADIYRNKLHDIEQASAWEYRALEIQKARFEGFKGASADYWDAKNKKDQAKNR